MKKYLGLYYRSLRFYSTSNDLTLGQNKIVSTKEIKKSSLSRTSVEHELKYIQKPDMPENPKLLKLSILGVPNSGKSTIVNRILNKRISSVSSRINTTRNRLTGVYTEEDTQLIILDTPGLIPYRKHKKLNLDRPLIVDPHSSLWETDLICVVHDVSDEYSRDKIDREILKCLFAHPEKETILILNKTDKLKNKEILLDIIADLTGGYLCGKEFISNKKIYSQTADPRRRDTINNYDYAKLFAKTADKMNIKLNAINNSNNPKDKHILNLLDELKQCEEYLLKNLENINVELKNDIQNKTDENGLPIEESSDKDLIEENEISRITLEKFKSPSQVIKKQNADLSSSHSEELKLIDSIVKSSENSIQSDVPLRRIEDISPMDFKKDLLETTNWHLYYKKLSALGILVRDKKHWPYFNQVFMVSALANQGIDDLRRYLLLRAKPADWMFSRDLLTDQLPQTIGEMIVREKMLEILPEEVPYELELQTVSWEVDEKDCLNIMMNIVSGGQKYKFKRHMATLFHNGATRLKLINEKAQRELENTFECEVKLKLIVITERV